jgi:L-2,4-diaminobutyrate decarboxylase
LNPRSNILRAYSPSLARRLMQFLAGRFEEHLEQSQAAAGKVLPWRTPQENIAEAAKFMGHGTENPCSSNDAVVDRFRNLVDLILSRSINLHHLHYTGHQVAPPPPLAAVFDAVSSLTNQGAAIYEMGPWSTAVEAALIAELGKTFGLPAGGFTGFATHGGSLANLTALLTARNIRFPSGWSKGIASLDKTPVLLVHADSHYCISRAAGILGLGTEQVLRLDIDAERRIDVPRLAAKLDELQREGVPVLAVVACACTTPTGAFDRLNQIADVCQPRGVWLHVDAAHGGAAAFSPRYRPLLAGIERADSFICDAHKMMFAPALCAFVFHRHRDQRFATFAQEAPYLYDPSTPGTADFDGGLLTLECTKRAMTYTIWGLWSLVGPQIFADMVEQTFDLGRAFGAMLKTAPDFELLHEPECNIVVFRHLPKRANGWSPAQVGEFNREIRRRIIESGSFYLVQTTLDGAGALRAVLMNPLTTVEELKALMEEIRRVGAAVSSKAGTL